MIKDFRKIYNKELKRYEYEGNLTYLILNSTDVRMFVYEVCKYCIASHETQQQQKSKSNKKAG